MAQLAADEIAVGLVAYLDQAMLSADTSVTDTYPQQSSQVRPFVCIALTGDQSTWAPLTTAFRVERVQILPTWRTGGQASWSGLSCYLNDGANLYIGPKLAFVAASYPEQTSRQSRSRMSADGIGAIQAEVERQRHRRQVAT